MTVNAKFEVNFLLLHNNLIGLEHLYAKSQFIEFLWSKKAFPLLQDCLDYWAITVYVVLYNPVVQGHLEKGPPSQ